MLFISKEGVILLKEIDCFLLKVTKKRIYHDAYSTDQE